MHHLRKKTSAWLLPGVLILFVMLIMVFPLAARYTYAGRAENPDHVLTYTTGKLTWDSATGIDASGAAMLKLFDSSYENVKSEDGGAVVAPGTEGFHYIRLKNNAKKTVKYTAVLYEIRTTEELPVEVSMGGTGLSDTDIYTLPASVKPGHVIRAVAGEVRRGALQDFDVEWLWRFEDGEEQDIQDTLLGDRSVLDPEKLTVGLYIVVEENSGNSGSHVVKPTTPQTGDDSHLGLYTAGICLSLLLLAVMGFFQIGLPQRLNSEEKE